MWKTYLVFSNVIFYSVHIFIIINALFEIDTSYPFVRVLYHCEGVSVTVIKYEVELLVLNTTGEINF